MKRNHCCMFTLIAQGEDDFDKISVYVFHVTDKLYDTAFYAIVTDYIAHTGGVARVSNCIMGYFVTSGEKLNLWVVRLAQSSRKCLRRTCTETFSFITSYAFVIKNRNQTKSEFDLERQFTYLVPQKALIIRLHNKVVYATEC